MGRLRYRRQQKKKALEDRMRALQMKLELACETYDPEAKRFSIEAAELKKVKQNIEVDLHELEQRMIRARKQFEPVYQMLQECNIMTAHPDDLLVRIESEREEKMLDYREVLVQGEMGTDIQAESALINEQRETLRSSQRAKMSAKKEQKMIVRAPQPPSMIGSASTRQSGMRSLERYQSMCKDVESRTSADAHQPVKNPQKAAKAQALKDTSARVQSMEGQTVVAVYSYTAKAGDELSFGKGDRIVCVSAGGDDGWFYGVCNHRSGMFPVNYVTLADP
jgi:hypothetical protein